MLRVLIVDDEPPARARIRQVLTDVAATAPHELVGEAANGVTALDLMDRLQPDVVLLDVHMPGMNGLEVARHLAARPQPCAEDHRAKRPRFARHGGSCQSVRGGKLRVES